MDDFEFSQFCKFKSEVMRYSVIDMASANILLSRFTAPLAGRRKFFSSWARLRYYKHWWRLLVKSGVLEARGIGYKVLKNGMD